MYSVLGRRIVNVFHLSCRCSTLILYRFYTVVEYCDYICGFIFCILCENVQLYRL